MFDILFDGTYSQPVLQAFLTAGVVGVAAIVGLLIGWQIGKWIDPLPSEGKP